MQSTKNEKRFFGNGILKTVRGFFGGEDAGFIGAMLSPAGLIFLLGIFFPLAYGVFISLFYISRTEQQFVGFANYFDLVFNDPDFIQYYYNTLLFTVVTVTAELLLGLIIALLLNKAFPGRGLVRAAVLVPWAVPTIVNAIIWEYIFKADFQGLVNDTLRRLGLIEKAIPFAGGITTWPINILWIFALFAFPITLGLTIVIWIPKIYRGLLRIFSTRKKQEPSGPFSQPLTALISDNLMGILSVVILLVSGFMLFVIPLDVFLPEGPLGLFAYGHFPSDFLVIFSVDIWKTTPFMALLILAGLQVIPQDLYKAAEVDGATAWQSFRHVTLPLLIPGIGTALIFRTIDAFRVYDILAVFTAQSIASITKYAVQKHQYGYYGAASAIAIIEFLNIVVFTVLLMYLTRRRGEL
ncbi:MAG: carbohydrate ABC transporter permease [Promethearchaeota archaeon]